MEFHLTTQTNDLHSPKIFNFATVGLSLLTDSIFAVLKSAHSSS